MNFCPLCGEPVIDENTDNIEYIKIRKQEQEKKLLTDYQKLTARQKRKLFWQISGIILLSGIFITFIIDFISHGTVTWSKYPIAVSAILFINTTLISFWFKRILLLLAGSFIATSFLLVFLDIFNASIGWGVKLGIPLLLAAYIIVYVFIKIVKSAKKKGLNIIAYSLIAAGLLSICTDGILSLYMKNQFKLEWSIITITSILPIVFILLYMHFKLKKGTDLKRFFHI
jgi:hypothetical protein